MGHELLHMFEQRPNGHPRADEDGRSAEDFWTRTNAGNLLLHGLSSPKGMYRVYAVRRFGVCQRSWPTRGGAALLCHITVVDDDVALRARVCFRLDGRVVVLLALLDGRRDLAELLIERALVRKTA